MMRRAMVWKVAAYASAALFALGPNPLPAGADRSGSPEAAEAIRELVDAYERDWNTHDPTAVAAYFTEDADLIMGNSARVSGRQEIRDWWRAYFDEIDPGRRGTFSVRSIRVLAPDVALLDVDSTTAGRDAAGGELPVRRARGTWVVVRREGDWRVAALRGLPALGDRRVAPGTDR